MAGTPTRPSAAEPGAQAGNPRGVDVNLRSGPQMREYRHIADRLAAESVGPVLDWGCGNGQITHLLRRRGMEVESFDYREGASPHVRRSEHYPDVAVHVSGDPVALPFPRDRFAAVLSCGVLEHVQYPERSLRELHRVLRPGGRLFIYKLPNRLSYLELLARGLGLYYHGKLPHDRVYDRRKATELLSRGNFRVDRFRRSNMVPLTLTGALAWRYAETVWRMNRRLESIPVVNLIATNLELQATAI